MWEWELSLSQRKMLCLVIGKIKFELNNRIITYFKKIQLLSCI